MVRHFNGPLCKSIVEKDHSLAYHKLNDFKLSLACLTQLVTTLAPLLTLVLLKVFLFNTAASNCCTLNITKHVFFKVISYLFRFNLPNTCLVLKVSFRYYRNNFRKKKEKKIVCYIALKFVESISIILAHEQFLAWAHYESQVRYGFLCISLCCMIQFYIFVVLQGELRSMTPPKICLKIETPCF